MHLKLSQFSLNFPHSSTIKGLHVKCPLAFQINITPFSTRLCAQRDWPVLARSSLDLWLLLGLGQWKARVDHWAGRETDQDVYSLASALPVTEGWPCPWTEGHSSFGNVLYTALSFLTTVPCSHCPLGKGKWTLPSRQPWDTSPKPAYVFTPVSWWMRLKINNIFWTGALEKWMGLASSIKLLKVCGTETTLFGLVCIFIFPKFHYFSHGKSLS